MMVVVRLSSGLVTVHLKTQLLTSQCLRLGCVDSSFMAVSLGGNLIFLVFGRKEADIPVQLGIGETVLCRQERNELVSQEDREMGGSGEPGRSQKTALSAAAPLLDTIRFQEHF